jgi:phosphoribosylglycinamide formyltransferase 1
MSDSHTESPASFPIVVLISGGGTTLQNLIDRIAAGTLPVRIVLVVSSRRNAAGVERAAKAGLPVHVIERRGFASLSAFSERIFDVCRAAGAQLICLAGYLQLLEIPADYRGKILNIHPALLPSFGGKGMYGHHVHKAVLDHGVKESGCTVHLVDDQYDHGPIVAQRSVEVEPDDTPETLAARVFEQECELYPEVIRAFVEGRVQVVGDQVQIRNSA